MHSLCHHFNHLFWTKQKTYLWMWPALAMTFSIPSQHRDFERTNACTTLLLGYYAVNKMATRFQVIMPISQMVLIWSLYSWISTMHNTKGSNNASVKNWSKDAITQSSKSLLKKNVETLNNGSCGRELQITSGLNFKSRKRCQRALFITCVKIQREDKRQRKCFRNRS